MARPCLIPPTKGEFSSHGSEISLIRGTASKIRINHRVNRKQFTFWQWTKNNEKSFSGKFMWPV